MVCTPLPLDSTSPMNLGCEYNSYYYNTGMDLIISNLLRISWSKLLNYFINSTVGEAISEHYPAINKGSTSLHAFGNNINYQ